MNDAPAEVAPQTKVDPELLVLRGSPRRIVRLHRGAIIGVAAFGSAAIVGVTWLALKPATFRLIAENEARGDAAAGRPPDVLASAPRSYGDVPKLGPPLPGDLGRPILQHQRSLGEQPAEDSSVAAPRTEEAAEAERQRIAAERSAARASGVMVRTSGSSSASAASLATATEGADPASAAEPSTRVAVDPGSDPNGQQRKLEFLSRRDEGSDVSAFGLRPPASPWMLSAGSVIAASLITGLNSDLPGLVIAQVTENAYDSATGRTLLVPQGSRLIGSYDSIVAFGQSRALLVWQRIIFPDGSSIRIDNLPASDSGGYAGLADRVDFHTWRLLKGVALSTLLGVGTELTFDSGESDLVRAVRESAQQNADRAGQKITERSLDIQPTITVRPGWPLRVVVHKDIVLQPWKE